MSKRCAYCSEFNPRRSLRPPGGWVDYLVDAGLSEPVGTLVLPLCREHYAEADDLQESADGEVTDEVAAFLDELDGDQVVDEVAG